MSQKDIVEIAEGYGLTVETVVVPDNKKRAYKVYKGANSVFVGTEEAVQDFFVDYEKNRPALYDGSIYGYKE